MQEKQKLTEHQNRLVCETVAKMVAEGISQDAVRDAQRFLVRQFIEVNQQPDCRTCQERHECRVDGGADEPTVVVAGPCKGRVFSD